MIVLEVFIGSFIGGLLSIVFCLASVLLAIVVLFVIIQLLKGHRGLNNSKDNASDPNVRKPSNVHKPNLNNKQNSNANSRYDRGLSSRRNTVTPSINKPELKVQKINSEDDKSDSIQKGKAFENRVAHYIRHKYPSIKVLTNRVYMIDGKSSEVDLILISDRGVISVECKSFNGLVVGNLKMKDWDVYYSKNNKFKILSPLLQNKGHIRTIRNVVNAPAENLVIFDDCTKVCDSLIKLDNIINFRDFDTYMFNFLSNDPIYKDNEVAYLYSELRDRGNGNLAYHVDYVNSLKANA